MSLQTDCTNNWDFHNSFFFAGTGDDIFNREDRSRLSETIMNNKDFDI